jgi:hypothetical protein
MLRFLHTADWQIGRAFRMVEGDAAALLRQARVDAIDRIGTLAVAEGASFVVVAGDVFDVEGMSNTALRAPVARMARFPQVTWYLLPGNHDPDRREGIWDRLARLDLPPNVRSVREAEPVSVGENAFLLPCPLTARAVADDPTAWMSQAETPPGAIRIGLAHGSIREFGGSETSLRAPLDPDRADKAGLSYLALGDWHRALRINARTWYSGTPEPDGFPSVGEVAVGQVLSVAVAGPAALPEVKPLVSGLYRWAEQEADLHEAADIEALESLACGLDDDPGRLYLRLRVRGALSLADRAAFDTRIGEALRAAVLALELNDDALAGEPDADDLDAIDKPGGVLRVAAETLAELADNGQSPEAPAARRALAMLFGYTRAGAGQ